MRVEILLDRSGSMITMWNEAVASINTYVKNLKKTDKVRLSVFDDEYNVIRDVKVKDWTDADKIQAISKVDAK